MADKFKAILEINPNAKVEITNGQITNWYDTTPISDADISSKMNEIDTRDAHIEPRQRAYPDLEEQLDSLYKDIVAGTVTTSGAFATAIKAVKDKYPKS